MIILPLLICYFMGSIPTGYLLTKAFKKVDIRTVGSGNIGATNTVRIAGWKTGIAVLILDTLKGVLATALVPRLMMFSPELTDILLCGLCSVIGHNFSCFLRFKGGKGVATTIGVLIGSVPAIAAIFACTWFVIFICFRYVSLGSIVGALAIPISQIFFKHEMPATLIGSSLALLIIARHHENIRRLLEGKENRMRQKSK